MSSTPTNEHPIIVGIDLGTTNSLVAWCDESGPCILEDENGGNLPSVVRYDEQGNVAAIGKPARDHAVEFPTTTLFSVKRLMGRGIADVQNELNYLPYAVVAGEHNTARVQVTEDKVVSPQEVSAIILRELKAKAEKALGKTVEKAVVTVPAYFDDAQRQATRDAGRIAGLDVVRIVNEPTAAALAYGLGVGEVDTPSETPNKTGSDPVSLNVNAKPLAQPNESGTVSLNTKFNTEACTTGSGADPNLTGELDDDLDHANSTVAVFDLGGGTFDVSILNLQQTEQGIVDQVVATSGDTHLGGDDVDRMIVELIQKEITVQLGQEIDFPPSTRQAFRSFAEATKIRLSNSEYAQLEIDLGEGRSYQRSITRDELEEMMTPWVDRAIACCKEALKKADLPPEDIDRVIMVGGSTRIPLVRKKVGELFGTVPYTALNPDEVVALGAAVQGSILAGINRDMLLLDVIPLSLGIETLGGAVAKLVMSNTTIPAKATEMFTTHAEGQTNVKIHILQGERELVKDCRSLGEFDLTGIPPMPAGLPKIEVTFLVDANGVLNVSAVEKRSEKAARVQIIPNHGLTREEVDRMETESMTHAREDMTAHQLIDLRNQARLDMRAIERQINKVGDELDDAYRVEIAQKVAIVQKFVDTENPDANEFHVALDAMDKATIRLAELAIKQTLAEEQ
ncbi:MAG: molecular chaperone DnaK [Phycisphaeraceae bacterium]|nr:molecular chaperone DnaK [Phycisphaeraceae bacterium]